MQTLKDFCGGLLPLANLLRIIKCLSTYSVPHHHLAAPAGYSNKQQMTIIADVLKAVPTTKRAIWLAENLTKLSREGGFHLTTFPTFVAFSQRLVLFKILMISGPVPSNSEGHFARTLENSCPVGRSCTRDFTNTLEYVG